MASDTAPARYPVNDAVPAPLVLDGAPLLAVAPLRVYTCGITPYAVTHVGHAATFVWADLLASVSKASGAKAEVSRNITDVDDVLTAAAARTGQPYDELASVQQFQFGRDMEALAVARPKHEPKARAHVASVIRLAVALLTNGAAYESEGYVYFRGTEVPGRAGLEVDEARELSRAYGDQHDVPGRESEFDVPVWRPSAEGDPAFPSPWGWGRPGWHAECAAMAVATFGSSVDVLVGGSDLAFPHHAYQAAMVEAATDVTPFARATLHVGEVRQDGVKMSKSLGNLELVADLLTRFPGPVVRLGLLHRDRHEPWECEDAVFEAAATTLDKLYAAAGSPAERADAGSGRDRVLAALLADLDVPAAVDVALAEGGDAARYLLDVLRVTERSA
ncbi:cysteine--tRNA ligase [Nocardioides bruguierae]|uniref:cysteine--tRNA ligase n=1 Tax=Nocardioides bruguierae TaxID=2945102 RepID=UPI00202220BE|nr:cysteine--tRNA ligase [Nocardioides bruguierae]MCL8025368.1 cysteine--tRNA ligase [Nocardioides bruguierae]